MQATLIMPNSGSKVRSQSQRRFVVVAEDRFAPGKPWIVKRSDNVETARTERNKARSKHINAMVVVFDTTTGEAVA